MTARVGGGLDRVARRLLTGGQGSKVYVLCAEPKENKYFRPGTRPGGSGTRPGGSVTGVTEKLSMCQMFICLFRPLYTAEKATKKERSKFPSPSVHFAYRLATICPSFLLLSSQKTAKSVNEEIVL